MPLPRPTRLAGAAPRRPALARALRAGLLATVIACGVGVAHVAHAQTADAQSTATNPKDAAKGVWEGMKQSGRSVAETGGRIGRAAKQTAGEAKPAAKATGKAAKETGRRVKRRVSGEKAAASANK